MRMLMVLFMFFTLVCPLFSYAENVSESISSTTTTLLAPEPVLISTDGQDQQSAALSDTLEEDSIYQQEYQASAQAKDYSFPLTVFVIILLVLVLFLLIFMLYERHKWRKDYYR